MQLLSRGENETMNLKCPGLIFFPKFEDQNKTSKFPSVHQVSDYTF